jgi:hypothetical protein
MGNAFVGQQCNDWINKWKKESVLGPLKIQTISEMKEWNVEIIYCHDLGVNIHF